MPDAIFLAWLFFAAMSASIVYATLLVLGTRLKTRCDRHALIGDSKRMRNEYLQKVAERAALRLAAHADDPDDSLSDVDILDDDAPLRQAA